MSSASASASVSADSSHSHSHPTAAVPPSSAASASSSFSSLSHPPHYFASLSDSSMDDSRPLNFLSMHSHSSASAGVQGQGQPQPLALLGLQHSSLLAPLGVQSLNALNEFPSSTGNSPFVSPGGIINDTGKTANTNASEAAQGSGASSSVQNSSDSQSPQNDFLYQLAMQNQLLQSQQLTAAYFAQMDQQQGQSQAQQMQMAALASQNGGNGGSDVLTSSGSSQASGSSFLNPLSGSNQSGQGSQGGASQSQAQQSLNSFLMGNPGLSRDQFAALSSLEGDSDGHSILSLNSVNSMAFNAANSAANGNSSLNLLNSNGLLSSNSVSSHVNMNPNGTASTKLLVKYLPPSLTQDQLQALFSPFGALVSCKLILDKKTQQSLGYGFIIYATPESAQAAITQLNGFVLNNRPIRVALAQPPDSHSNNSKSTVYVSGLPLGYGLADLTALCSMYGSVLDTKILCDLNTGASRGIGFCQMESSSAARKCIENLHGKVLTEGGEALIVKFAKEFRRDSVNSGSLNLVASIHGASQPPKESINNMNAVHALSALLGSSAGQQNGNALLNDTAVVQLAQKLGNLNNLASLNSMGGNFLPSSTDQINFYLQQQQAQNQVAQLLLAQSNTAGAAAAAHSNPSAGIIGSGSTNAGAFHLNAAHSLPSHPNLTAGAGLGDLNGRANGVQNSFLNSFNSSGSPLGVAGLTGLNSFNSTGPLSVSALNQSAAPNNLLNSLTSTLNQLNLNQVNPNAGAGNLLLSNSAAPNAASLFNASAQFHSPASAAPMIDLNSLNLNNPAHLALLNQSNMKLIEPLYGNKKSGYSLFCFHIPADFTEEQLKNLFSLNGTCPVMSVSLAPDPESGGKLSRGFGFVNMYNFADAVKCVKTLNGMQIGKKFIKVQFKNKHHNQGKNTGVGMGMGGMGMPGGSGLHSNQSVQNNSLNPLANPLLFNIDLNLNSNQNANSAGQAFGNLGFGSSLLSSNPSSSLLMSNAGQSGAAAGLGTQSPVNSSMSADNFTAPSFNLSAFN